MDELFPDVPVVVQVVAISITVGGDCAHCQRPVRRGHGVYKLAPTCCEPHRKPHTQGSKNGPGRWVCGECAALLTKE